MRKTDLEPSFYTEIIPFSSHEDNSIRHPEENNIFLNAAVDLEKM